MRRLSRQGDSDQIPIDGEIRARSEKAVKFYDGTKEVWLPLSQIEVSTDNKSVLVPEWLAKEKGLI